MISDWEYNKIDYPESYTTHRLFDELDYYEEFYEAISMGCHRFVPNGVETMLNYFSRMLLNCYHIYMEKGAREKYLDYASKVLKHVFTLHLSFIFYLNPQYLMASIYTDYLDEGATPPKGSENWIANYAQEAFDKFIKTDEKLFAFLKNNCWLQIL